MKHLFLVPLSLALGCAAAVSAATKVPYYKIANPTAISGVDQRVRDSATLRPSRLRVNQAGYRKADADSGLAKFYYYMPTGGSPIFSVIDTLTGKQVGTGTVHDKGFKSSTKFGVKASNWAGLVSGGDTRYTMSTDGLGTSISTSEVYEGSLPTTGLSESGVYRIVIGSDTSAPFLVSDSVYGYVRDAIHRFFAINRSGAGNSWFHPSSHMKDGFLAVPSDPGSYTGGWYDCGDHLKEPQTMAYVLATLATLAGTLPERDADDYGDGDGVSTRVDGIPDMLNEAHYGAKFFLHSWVLNGMTTGPGKAVSLADTAGKGGSTAGMITGVGDYGKDHGWWGRPENQDAMTESGRGGYKERSLRSELGANTLGDVAAGLAILSKRWRAYDAAWADTALQAAKDMYAYAKTHKLVVSSPAYNGSGSDKINANLALAATALLWATHDTMYLNDIAYDTSIGSKGSKFTPKSSWEGGWMVMSNPNLTKGGANTDWGNRHQLALYAFYKLILADKDSALNSYGIKNETERENLITHTVAGVIQNLNSISGSSQIQIALPSVDPNDGGGYAIRTDSAWFKMYTQQEWVWNRYYIANAAELFFYYDITKDLEAGLAGTSLTQYVWNRDKVKQLMVRMWDYQLGVNPWDVSMLMGVGKKNFNHPHHRAANPEGRNTPGATYSYKVPVGALYGGYDPTTRGENDSGFTDYWNDYTHTEVCSDAAATSIMAAVGLSNDVNLKIPPHASVKVVYVSDTMAQIEVTTDKYGTVTLNYGTTQGSYTGSVTSDSAGVEFVFFVKGLSKNTLYYFNVVSKDLVGNDTTQDHWVNPAPDGTPYSFTTKAQSQGDATITGVKVCNVTADSAEIMWYTPNGEYQSSICWSTTKPVGTTTSGSTTCAMDADVSGYPVKFHYVKIGGLTEQTTYYFQVASDGSNGVWDDNGGKFYQFTTPVRMANFGIYALQYEWSGMPALAINVMNNEARNYDSLSARVYVRSVDTIGTNWSTGNPTSQPMAFSDAMAVRYDICQAYDGAGFNKPCDDSHWGISWDWGTMTGNGWSTLNRGVQMLHPVMMPETWDSATKTHVYYFDLPLGPTMMTQGSRIRFDVIFAKRSPYPKQLTQDQDSLALWVSNFVDMSRRTLPQVGDWGYYDALSEVFPLHPMGKDVSQDWSWIKHSTSAGDPLDFVGIPKVADQTAANALIDAMSDSVPLNPYITVYRKGVFVYGYSPSSTEQATKKSYWGIDVSLDPPFDDTASPTITLDAGSSTIHVKGLANVYDKLTPAAKGVVSEIWVNGSKLSASELASAAVKNDSGWYDLNIPVKLGVGGNTVDITIFGGSGTCSDTAVTCDDGCAFYNATFFIQFTKGKSTSSSIALIDGSTLGALPDTLIPGTSSVVVEVRDNDNNLASGSKDKVKVTLYSNTGKDSVIVTLTETGDSTGIFRSEPISIGSSGWSTTSVSPSDTLIARYTDENDTEDVSYAYAKIKSMWPSAQSAKIVRGCDGAYAASIIFDKALTTVGSDNDTVNLKSADGTEKTIVVAAADQALNGTTLTLPLGSSGDPTWTGSVNLLVADASGNTKVLTVKLSDGVGPWLDSAKIIENYTSSSTDTLHFWPSENVYLPQSSWFLNVTRDGAAVSTSSAVIDTVWLADSATHRYVMVFSGVKVQTGDSVSLMSSVTDYAGNTPDTCHGLIRLRSISRGVPVTAAWLKDSDGDGRADLLTVVYSRALSVSKQEVPDSMVVVFGRGDTVRVAVQPSNLSKWTTDDSVFTVTLDEPFPASATTGSLADGGGKLYAPTKGSAIDWTTPDHEVADSVAANAFSARLRYGEDKDTLLVIATENVSATDRANMVIRIRGGVTLGGGTITGDTIRIVVDSGTIVVLEDSVKLTVSMVDQFGNVTVKASPAVLVKGGEHPPTSAWYEDSDGDGTVDAVVLNFPKAIRTAPKFALRWPNRLGSLVTDTVMASSEDSGSVTLRLTVKGMDSLVTSYDSITYPARTLGTMIDTATGDSINFSIADHVAPVLVSAALRYGNEETQENDTLELVFSEPVQTVDGKVVVQNHASQILVGNSYAVSGNTILLFLDSTANIQRGDSLAAAPGALGTLSDLLGNSPTVVGRWVPITFGKRKSVFTVTVQNPVQIYSDWFSTGTEVNTGSTGVSLLVRSPNGQWQTLDGTVISDQEALEKQGMGVVITANEALNGFVYIYDHIGVYVAGIDLSKYYKAFNDNSLVPKSATGRTQLWIRWDGRTAGGAIAATGVYTLRLVTRRDTGTVGLDANGHFLNQLFKMGWKRTAK